MLTFIASILRPFSVGQRADRRMSGPHTGCRHGDGKGKGKGKGYPITGHEGPEGEKRYSCTLPLTSALDGVGGQGHAPAALTLGKTRYPLYRRLGGPQGPSGLVLKISPPPGLDPRT